MKLNILSNKYTEHGIKVMSFTIKDAIRLAKAMHAGQTYGGELDYYEAHVMAVVRSIMEYPESTPTMVMTAILHDVLEDTPLTQSGMVERCVPADVIEAVSTLTRRKDEVYLDYILRIRDSKNPNAIVVKLADLEVNMNNNPPPSLLKRYEKAAKILLNEV